MKRKGFKILLIAVLSTAGVIALARTVYVKNDGRKKLPSADLKEELRKMYSNTLTDSTIGVAATIRLFDGENPTIKKEEKTFSFYKSGEKLYSRLDNMQTLSDGKIVVQLDTVNKFVVVAAASAGENMQMASPLMLQQLVSDSALSSITGFVEEENGNHIATFSNPNTPQIKSCSFTYDTLRYAISKASMAWWKDGVATDTTNAKRVWLTNIDYKKVMDVKYDVDAMINEIVIVKDNNVTLTEKYKDFQLRVL
ncbi:hypothetical protein [Pinibacter aurantiacus]|uniref:Uncharacterized protein n=1 Tax=Pinibacter aurantiacus TaxID=2851599 RepID=A0A9E2SCS3_9BACT|nr:hypothetical protein [Pinibacter aurantiacus]MBV4358903.1 hypothetical protein [Pinibacter aurantiacus]